MALPQVADLDTAALPTPSLLLVGFDSATVAQLSEILPSNAAYKAAQHAAPQDWLRCVEDVPAMLAELARAPASVLCLGPGAANETAHRALSEAVEKYPDAARSQLVLEAGEHLERFQEFIDQDQLFYLSRRTLALDELAPLLTSALAHHRRKLATGSGPREQIVVSADDRYLDRILHHSQLMAAESDLKGAEGLAVEAIEELVEAQRAWLLFYDAASESLWSPLRADSDERESAAAGLVSFVARTGNAIRREQVGDDPRFDEEADNPDGKPDEHFLAVPILAPQTGNTEIGSPGADDVHVLAVLVAVRHASRPVFTASEQRRLELLADQFAPRMVGLARKARLRSGSDSVFREEALAHHQAGLRDQGDLLRISPSWTRWVYWVLLAVLVVAFAYSLIGRINEYASGPAVIRAAGQAELTAPISGTVTSVEVEAGQAVRAGDLLVTFYSSQELADLERIEKEIRLQLLNRLRNPADVSTERSLLALQSQLDLAQSRLADRSVRAPHDGVVSDVRIRASQFVSPGQLLLSLRRHAQQLYLTALLPGQYRPLIRPGQPLRMELSGYAYTYQHLVVETVSEQVIGPSEARRALGPAIAEALPILGPVILVEARLESTQFESDGEIYEFHDGMHGTAEVRVRSEPILLTLVPGLKALRQN